MAFFNDEFLKNKNKENIDELINKNTENNMQHSNINNTKKNITTRTEIEVNRKNKEEYEKIMQEAQSNYDMYYDKNNWFVKLILFLLLVVIIGGVAYYALLYFSLI